MNWGGCSRKRLQHHLRRCTGIYMVGRGGNEEEPVRIIVASADARTRHRQNTVGPNSSLNQHNCFQRCCSRAISRKSDAEIKVRVKCDSICSRNSCSRGAVISRRGIGQEWKVTRFTLTGPHVSLRSVRLNEEKLYRTFCFTTLSHIFLLFVVVLLFPRRRIVRLWSSVLLHRIINVCTEDGGQSVFIVRIMRNVQNISSSSLYPKI